MYISLPILNSTKYEVYISLHILNSIYFPTWLVRASKNSVFAGCSKIAAGGAPRAAVCLELYRLCFVATPTSFGTRGGFVLLVQGHPSPLLLSLVCCIGMLQRKAQAKIDET